MKKEDIIYLTVGSIFVIGIIVIIYNIFTMDTTIYKTTSKVANSKQEIINKNSTTDKKVDDVKTKVVKSVDEDDSYKRGERYRIPKVFIEKNHLPPYPGKDGGPGVYGSDVNHNNIRDDMEREIAWVFRNNPEVRDAFYADAISDKLDMDLAVKKDYSPESEREMKKRVSRVLDCKDYYLDKKYSGFKALSEEQKKYDFGKRYYYSTPERRKMTDSYEKGVLNSTSGLGSIEEIIAFKNRGKKPGEMNEDEEDDYRDQHPEMMEEFCKNLVADLLNK